MATFCGRKAELQPTKAATPPASANYPLENTNTTTPTPAHHKKLERNPTSGSRSNAFRPYLVIARLRTLA